ncbi:DUF7573 domain-containing protein [Halorubrum depositum]|uniref:DUF7573 domain-containing protein n=1 Tax=Halorubrum depositum TaxID=2583992 RepID=UPI0011A869C9|nr:hypothetical protein [Halorubrum depositum]
MPEDRSLDEFAGGADEGAVDAVDTDEGAGAVDAVDTDEERGAADADEKETTDGLTAHAEPATPTATWTTGGAACDRCGDSVARRWVDDGALVCAACKEW